MVKPGLQAKVVACCLGELQKSLMLCDLRHGCGSHRTRSCNSTHATRWGAGSRRHVAHWRLDRNVARSSGCPASWIGAVFAKSRSGAETSCLTSFTTTMVCPAAGFDAKDGKTSSRGSTLANSVA